MCQSCWLHVIWLILSESLYHHNHHHYQHHHHYQWQRRKPREVKSIIQSFLIKKQQIGLQKALLTSLYQFLNLPYTYGSRMIVMSTKIGTRNSSMVESLACWYKPSVPTLAALHVSGGILIPLFFGSLVPQQTLCCPVHHKLFYNL